MIIFMNDEHYRQIMDLRDRVQRKRDYIDSQNARRRLVRWCVLAFFSIIVLCKMVSNYHTPTSVHSTSTYDVMEATDILDRMKSIENRTNSQRTTYSFSSYPPSTIMTNTDVTNGNATETASQSTSEIRGASEDRTIRYIKYSSPATPLNSKQVYYGSV